MEAVAARDAVIAHLTVLEACVPLLALHDPGRASNTALLLHAACARWNAAAERGVIDVTLATESCEVVVSVLRLLRGELVLGPSEAAVQYTSAFLVLACTVRVFEVAPDVPSSGQTVTVHSLQSAVGLQLNGARGVVVRFHAESGRFIVRIHENDPPQDWKKMKAENLALDPGTARPVDSARQHGRDCLEAVADVFDDLLQEMLAEAPDLEEESMIMFLHAELASSMWETVMCCAGDGALHLSGADLLELCGGADLCALLARHVLCAHRGLGALMGAFGATEQGEIMHIHRICSLQGSLARAYCDLYQPAALWGGRGHATAGDAPMQQLQADLDVHVRRAAEAAVNFGVLPALIDATNFQLAGEQQHVPLVLSVLLSRLVCSLLAPGMALTGQSFDATGVLPTCALLSRHVRLHSAMIVATVHTFLSLTVPRLEAIAVVPEGAAEAGELLAAIRVMLDAIIAVVANGYNVGAAFHEHAMLLLNGSYTRGDPAMLARLCLIFVGQPADMLQEHMAAACAEIPGQSRGVLWRKVRSGAKLRRLDVLSAQELVQEWLGFGFEAVEDGDVSPVAASGAWEREIDGILDKCMMDMPDFLREMDMPAPSASGTDPQSQVANGLGALGLPALPGQQQPNGAQRQRVQKLGRAALGKIRGVDTSTAPAELRCAIDGRVMGEPIRSPYGHVFERSTLEEWVSMCGSVCPVTNQPLRIEDCTVDNEVERRVLEWARAGKANHKNRAQERRRQRKEEAAATGDMADSELC